MVCARCLPLTLIVALTSFNMGCGGDDTADEPPATTQAANDSEDPLVGKWRTHHYYYVVRTAEGRYDLGYTPDGVETEPFGRGTYTYDEDEGILTFTSDAGTHCGAGSTGTYGAEIAADGDSVTFTLIEDPCSARHMNMSGEQTRYPRSP